MILQILTSYGIVYLVAESNLFEKPRAWIAKKSHFLGELIYCPICTSFWVGLIYTGSLTKAFAILGIVAIIKTINNGK
jgi:hypothetical protein